MHHPALEKMTRPAPYVDASVNRYAASQMQQVPAQRMQENAQMNNFSGQPHVPSRADGQQQWDTNPQIELNPMSPHSYSQGHKGNANQSLSQEQMANLKVDYGNQANNDPRLQSYEQDMEIGYEDNKPSELTVEGLEQKFQDDVMKLMKELSDAEDAEIARHKERITEINSRYQENLSSIRVQHAAGIGELLRKESQARLHQYQRAQFSPHLTERGLSGPRDYGWAAGAELPWPYPYEITPDKHGAKRSQGPEVRVPYPHGRVYNSSGGRYY